MISLHAGSGKIIIRRVGCFLIKGGLAGHTYAQNAYTACCHAFWGQRVGSFLRYLKNSFYIERPNVRRRAATQKVAIINIGAPWIHVKNYDPHSESIEKGPTVGKTPRHGKSMEIFIKGPDDSGCKMQVFPHTLTDPKKPEKLRCP